MKRRKCRICKKFKSTTKFGKLKASSDGVNTVCKSCNVKAVRKSYYKHLKRKRLAGKKSAAKWRKANKNHISKHLKEYYEKNSKRIKKRQKKYAKNNPKKRKATSKKYYSKNKIRYKYNLRRWRKANPKRAKAHSNARARRIRKATPKWLSKALFNKIVKFYEKCPKNKTVDHIIPIAGKKVFGLNVPWNLQYLTRPENARKGNRIDLLQASEWYGKILEEVGLK